ncbi:MAG: structural protein P5 [Alphaproteobacteria bacterium]|nr:structural protein P5 [Alphaproteobacteria bacterium]MDE2029911.1 structural protein P5 [Alphaproteobacteria bacterium]
MTTTIPSRGMRNNNPGNIRKSKDPWQGLAEQQTDADFFVFQSPIYGIRAIARTLITYQDKYGLQTVNDLIGRWAPPNENQTNAYVAEVVAKTGFTASQSVNMHSYTDLKPVVKAIILQENGQQPYTDAQIDKALVLAGVEPPVQNLQQSRTVKGGQTATAATVGVGVLEAVRESVDPARDALLSIAPYLDGVKWLLLSVTLIGIGVMIWARIDDRRKGLR